MQVLQAKGAKWAGRRGAAAAAVCSQKLLMVACCAIHVGCTHCQSLVTHAGLYLRSTHRLLLLQMYVALCVKTKS